MTSYYPAKLKFNLIAAAACYVQLNTHKAPTTMLYTYVCIVNLCMYLYYKYRYTA